MFALFATLLEAITNFPLPSDVVIVIVILSREFLVTSLRLIASSNGKVIAANSLGKIKNITYMMKKM